MGLDVQVQTIPLAAHESAMVRDHKLIRWLVIGWAASVLLMCAVFGFIIYAYATAEYDVVTETTTTETTTTTDENTANSGDGGVAFAGEGDLTVGNGK